MQNTDSIELVVDSFWILSARATLSSLWWIQWDWTPWNEFRLNINWLTNNPTYQPWMTVAVWNPITMQHESILVSQLVTMFQPVLTGNGIVWDGSSINPIRLDVDTLSNLPTPIVWTDEIIVNRWWQEYKTPASQFLDPFDRWRFADETALLTAYPNGIPTPSDRNWWFVRLWSTDSVWTRDADTNSWVDTDTTPIIYTASEWATMVGTDMQLEIANLTRTVVDTANGVIEDTHELALTEWPNGDYRATLLDLKEYILEQRLTIVEPLTVLSTNVVWTLSQTPISPVRIYVWWWGAWALAYIEWVHFGLSLWVATFYPAMTGFNVVSGDLVRAEYQYLWTASTIQQYTVENVPVVATNTLDTLNNSPTSLVVLIVNWLSYIENVHFTRSWFTLTRLPLVTGFNLVSGDQVHAVYYY